MTSQSFFHRGTEIVKIENEFLLNNEDFQEDYIYASRGFVHAVELGLIPTDETTTEWHHYFTKDVELTWKANKIFFK